MYRSTLHIDDEKLRAVLQAEDDWKRDRSSIEWDGETLVITAKDIIAYKATINGLIKLIETYERISGAL